MVEGHVELLEGQCALVGGSVVGVHHIQHLFAFRQLRKGHEKQSRLTWCCWQHLSTAATAERDPICCAACTWMLLKTAGSEAEHTASMQRQAVDTCDRSLGTCQVHSPLNTNDRTGTVGELKQNILSTIGVDSLRGGCWCGRNGWVWRPASPVTSAQRQPGCGARWGALHEVQSRRWPSGCLRYSVMQRTWRPDEKWAEEIGLCCGSKGRGR